MKEVKNKRSRQAQRDPESKRSSQSIIGYLNAFEQGSWKFDRIAQAAVLKEIFDVNIIDKEHFLVALKYFASNKSRLTA